MGGLLLGSTSLDSRSCAGGDPCYFYNAIVLESSFWRWGASGLSWSSACCVCCFVFCQRPELEVPGKRGPQLRNIPHQFGLWACLWGILINVDVGGPSPPRTRSPLDK